jgi:hypothetical protein
MIQIPKEKTVAIDSLDQSKRKIKSFDLPLARFIKKNKNSSVLFTRQGRTTDSKLYFTQKDLSLVRRGQKFYRVTGQVDSVASRNFTAIQRSRPSFVYSKKVYEPIYDGIKDRYSSFRNYCIDLIDNSVQGVSAVRMWNISVVSSLIFGMFLMTMIYRYLGQGAMAGSKKSFSSTNSQVLGEAVSKQDANDNYIEQLAGQIITADIEANNKKKQPSDFEKKIGAMVKGYPIEKMVPYIAKKDKLVAAFMISIARKESSWGVHVPLNNGQECYNDWGFRAKREKMGTGGHTCFDSPQDAVDSVAKRIESIINKEKITTPKGMVVVWKCGYDCSWDKPGAVNKWVSDVEGTFNDVKAFEKD